MSEPEWLTTETEVNHFKYWFIPIIWLFHPKAWLFKVLYQQKRIVTYDPYDNPLRTHYFLIRYERKQS